MSAEQPGVTPSQPARSAVEVQKETSHFLRGSIGDDLAKDVDHFGDADKNLLKFHGTYQQEDRDARKARKPGGLGKHYMFMVRCKIPGGRVTAAQYLALDELTERCANGTLRVTSRQGIQFHGVLKTNLKATIAGINETLLTTLGACGDVNRNVMACPAPHRHDGVREQMQATAARLAHHFAPRSGAYHEIWLNGTRNSELGTRNENQEETVAKSSDSSAVPHSEFRVPSSVEEPIYGKAYLPRKFKIGLALPEDNCVDVYAHDLGLLAIAEGGELKGFNFLVGGGMGMTHGNDKTFPHVGRPICYVSLAAVVESAEAVVKLFRDHGNRVDRKRARIKYLVHDWGVERFRQVLADYLPGPLELPRPIEVTGYDLHLGAHPQGDGKWWYGVSIENGRIKDEGTLHLRTALRTIVERFRPTLRLTPGQDVLLCDLDGSALPMIEALLGEHGVARPEELSNLRKHSLACPAIPTCGLALSESERSLPALLDELEVLLKELGLERETLSVRMTGCPNGCVRPYQSDIGLVGRSGDKYTLFVGGHIRGDRLNFELKDLVSRNQLIATLRPLLLRFKEERQADESFGDYCQRAGAESLRALVH